MPEVLDEDRLLVSSADGPGPLAVSREYVRRFLAGEMDLLPEIGEDPLGLGALA